MRKKYAARMLKILSFILAVAASVSLLQNVVLRRYDHNSMRLDGYYLEENGELDAVFLGASEVYSGFSSAYAYQRHGFTSYPYSTESPAAASMKTALKEILRTQKPQLIVVEINPFIYGNSDNEQNEGHIHKLIDNVPLNGNKIEYISNNVEQNQIEFYMPIIKYHSLWTDVSSRAGLMIRTARQSMRGYAALRGFRTKTDVIKPEEAVQNDKIKNPTDKQELNPQLEKELRAFLDCCRYNNLENVLFVRFPHIVTNKSLNRAKRINKAEEIIKSRGFDFLNLEAQYDKAKIDIDTDFYNYEHLNINGAVKLTEYLSDYIVNKYGIKPAKLSEEKASQWENSVLSFEKLREQCVELFSKKTVTYIGDDTEEI